MTVTNELLDRYTKERAESAFAELVKGHIDLVYSTALRHVRSPHLAQEVAQSVFIDLARQCGQIKAGTPLVAWLHLVARRTAMDMLRKESRRRSYERSAADIMSICTDESDSSPSWKEIEPLIDQAVESLKPIDRAAVLLRFFEDKSFQDVAAIIGSTDDAAQKRVSRALEQLRQFLTRRGVVLTAAGLSSRLETNAIHAAPTSLAPTISLAVSASKASALIHLISPIREIAMTTAQKLLAGTIFTAAVAGGIYQSQEIGRQKIELNELHRQAQQYERVLRAEREAHEGALGSMSEALKAEQLKTALLASQDPQAESALDAWLQKVVSLRKHLKQNPRYHIPELAFLEDKDWLDATKDIQLTDEWDYRSALSTLRRLAKGRLFMQISSAIPRYLKASNGSRPKEPSDLAAYMEKPTDPAIWPRYSIIAAKDASSDAPRFVLPNGGSAEWLITDKAPVDEYFDSTFFGSEYGVGVMGRGKFDKEVYDARRTFRSAHSDEDPTSAMQLAPYLHSAIDPAFIERQLKHIF